MVTNLSAWRHARIFIGFACLAATSFSLGFTAQPSQAQSASNWAPKVVHPGQPMTVYTEWTEGPPISEIRIGTPSDWRVLSVEVIDKARTTRVTAPVVEGKAAWTAKLATSLPPPFRIAVTTVAGSSMENGLVRIQPYWKVANFLGERLDPVRGPIDFTITAEEPRKSTGRALSFEKASRVNHGTVAELPLLPASESLTVSFWFQTNDREKVLLSTWTGLEGASYPFEFVIDAGGNLRCFSGSQGMHYSVVSDRPVADGTWHHVTYVRDATDGKAQLYLDGRIADSVYLQSFEDGQTFPISIGRRVKDKQSVTSGRFDELAVWSHARTADQILADLRLPARNISDAPVLLLDFERETDTSASSDLENPDSILSSSDLALHQPVRNAMAKLEGGAIALEWSIAGSEAQTVSLERSVDGSLFVPVYLMVTSSDERGGNDIKRPFRFQDVDIDHSTVFFYRFRQDFADGSQLVSSTLKVGLGDSDVPSTFELVGNSPNPFMTSTQIFFELTETMAVRLSVWDISGHLVEWLVDETKDAGLHQVQFTATDMPSGTYFVRLESSQGVVTQKMILRK